MIQVSVEKTKSEFRNYDKGIESFINTKPSELRKSNQNLPKNKVFSVENEYTEW